MDQAYHAESAQIPLTIFAEALATLLIDIRRLNRPTTDQEIIDRTYAMVANLEAAMKQEAVRYHNDVRHKASH